MKIPVASDHAGFEAKKSIIKILEDLGHEPIDYGTNSNESVDYPDYAKKVASEVDRGVHNYGILVCGSGQGMCMAANKFQNVRAALAYDEKSAGLTRAHNKSNVLCLPGRELSDQALTAIIGKWLQTDFEGGRHQRRVNKISRINHNETNS